MSELVRPVSQVPRTANAVEPEMTTVRKEMQAHRFHYMRIIVQRLASQAKLRVPLNRAAQIVWTLASPDARQALAVLQFQPQRSQGRYAPRPRAEDADLASTTGSRQCGPAPLTYWTGDAGPVPAPVALMAAAMSDRSSSFSSRDAAGSHPST